MFRGNLTMGFLSRSRSDRRVSIFRYGHRRRGSAPTQSPRIVSIAQMLKMPSNAFVNFGDEHGWVPVDTERRNVQGGLRSCLDPARAALSAPLRAGAHEQPGFGRRSRSRLRRQGAGEHGEVRAGHESARLAVHDPAQLLHLRYPAQPAVTTIPEGTRWAADGVFSSRPGRRRHAEPRAGRDREAAAEISAKSSCSWFSKT